MSPPFRVPPGGRFGRLIARDSPIQFRYDGRRFSGLRGDTLGSALLAAGVRILGRSARFRRPRGFYALGDWDPSARFVVTTAAGAVSGLCADEIELAPDLAARSERGWPSARFDLGGVFDRHDVLQHARTVERYLKRLRPPSSPPLLPTGRVPADTLHAETDLLVIGGGLAGLVAADVAAQDGLRVVLADSGPRLGGLADLYDGRIDGRLLGDGAAERGRALAGRDNVQILLRTRAVTLDADGAATLVERTADGAAGRVHLVAAQAVVVATGARERPLVFGNNDRPGVMLATTARALLRRHAVAPGRAAVVVTAGDDGYRSAIDLQDAGVEVRRIVDLRLRPDGAVVDMVKARGVSISFASTVVDVTTRRGGEVTAVTVENRYSFDNYVQSNRLDCDTLVVAGGWDAAAELATGAGAELRLDAEAGLFRVAAAPEAIRVAGSAAGRLDAEEVVADGLAAGAWAAARVHGGLRRRGRRPAPEVSVTRDWPGELPAPVLGKAPGRDARAFVDLGADAAMRDLRAGIREEPDAPGALEAARVGHGPHRGALALGVGVAAYAALAGKDPASVRPSPVDRPGGRVGFAELAAAASRPGEAPRRSPLGEPDAGATTTTEAGWRRVAAYPQDGETLEAAIRREARLARTAAGLLDATPEGRLVFEGPDAAELIGRLVASEPPPPGGSASAVLLAASGYVRAVATLARPRPDLFVLSSPPGTADATAAAANGLADELGVQVVDATERLACAMLIGERAAEIVSAVLPGPDLAPGRAVEAASGGAELLLVGSRHAGAPAWRILLPAGCFAALWARLAGALGACGGARIGTAALERLALEAGRPALDGTTTPDDLGLAIRPAAGGAFIGAEALVAIRAAGGTRRALVGLVPAAPDAAIEPGGQLVEAPLAAPPRATIGWIVSAGFSPARAGEVALALVAGGRERHGQAVIALQRETPVALTVVPAGELLAAPGPEGGAA